MSAVVVKETAPGKWLVGKDKWEVGRRYRLEKMIGRGAYGTVVSAQDKHKKSYVAIKRIESRALSNTTDLLRILREISILARVKHPHVVSLLCVLPPPPKPKVMQHLYVILEYAGTDLHKIFRSHTFMTADLVQACTLHCSDCRVRRKKPAIGSAGWWGCLSSLGSSSDTAAPDASMVKQGD